MNLAIRGISYHLGDRAVSTFSDDQHKELKFDYIMANPPFNLKNMPNTEVLKPIPDGKAMESLLPAMPTMRGFFIFLTN